jgi:hypothetical protein
MPPSDLLGQEERSSMAESPFLLTGSRDMPSNGAGREIPSQPIAPSQGGEMDPYIDIRHALRSEHAALSTDELNVVVGRQPMLIVLHRMLASPEPQQAALAALLGKAGRRSLRLNGSDVPLPAYLRLLSRLCREAAEQTEADVEAGPVAAPPVRETEDREGEEITPAALRELQSELSSASTAAQAEQETPQSGHPQCVNSTYEISGFPEYAVRPDQLSIQQQTLLAQIASEIAASFATNTPIVAVLAVGHADVALRKPAAERAAFEHAISQQRAENVIGLIMNEVRQRAGAASGTFISAMQTRSLGVGSTQRLMMNPRTEFERGINRRVVVLLARCSLPPDPVPPVDDGQRLKQNVERLLKLTETRRVDPDSTGQRTARARCLLQKLLKPGVVHVFVDGGVANETINGHKAGYYDCLVPGRNVGWKGNYDSTRNPMPREEFMKFLATAKPILNNIDPSQSDDMMLKALGDLTYRIDLGIEMTDQYIALMGMMSDPWVKLLFQKDGFAGDAARKKLQSIYRNNLNDDNNIYSCWK